MRPRWDCKVCKGAGYVREDIGFSGYSVRRCSCIDIEQGRLPVWVVLLAAAWMALYVVVFGFG